MKYKELLLENRILNLSNYLSIFDDSIRKNFLEKLIKQEAQHSFNQGEIFHHELQSDWDKKDFKNKTLIKFQPNIETKNKFSHVVDWLRDLPSNQYQSLRGIQNLDIAYDHANRYFAAKNKKANSAEDEDGLEIVYRFKDGMFFAKLNSSQCLDREGKLMQHCVGSYAEEVDKGNVIIYSLRDKKNQPHATLEARGKEIHQIKGKQNEAPVKKYIPYIREFILKNNFDIEEDEENIGLIKLNGKLYNENDLESWPTEISDDIILNNIQGNNFPDFKINGSLFLYNCSFKTISPKLKVRNSLTIFDTPIDFIPFVSPKINIHSCRGIKLEEKYKELLINNSIVEFSNYLETERLDISECTIDKLPSGKTNKLILDFVSNIDLKNFNITGDIRIDRSQIKNIQNKIDGDFMFNRSKIETIPDIFTVNGKCSFNNSIIKNDLNISKMTVLVSLDLEKSSIKILPDILIVGGNLNIKNTNIKKLPQKIFVGGEIFLNDYIKLSSDQLEQISNPNNLQKLLGNNNENN